MCELYVVVVEPVGDFFEEVGVVDVDGLAVSVGGVGDFDGFGVDDEEYPVVVCGFGDAEAAEVGFADEGGVGLDVLVEDGGYG